MDDPTSIVDAPSKPPQRFRRTRIAVSVFFGVLTMALCVLWVRSFSTREHLRWRVTTSRAISISSREGIIGVSTWTKNLDGVSSYVHSGPVFGSPPRRQMANPLGFEFIHSKEYDGLSVVVPYWFTVLTCAICVTIPHALKSHRFSLRTKLIVTTLVAVVLGLGVWVVR